MSDGSVILSPDQAPRTRQAVMAEVGAMIQAYARGPKSARFVLPEDCVRLQAALAARGIVADVNVGPDRKFAVSVTAYSAQPPLERVRLSILRAFDDGRLGVVAATYNVAEKKLRDFACGDNAALAVEVIARMFQRIALKGSL